MSSEFLPILKKVGLFSELQNNDAALIFIESCMTQKKFEKDHVLIKQGDATGSDFFVLIAGQVSIYKKTPEGDEYKVAVLNGSMTPGFGEGGLMEGEVRSATITCDTSVVCYVLSREGFNKIGMEHPEYAFPIIKKIAQNLMKTLNQTSQDLMLLHQALMNEIRSS